MTRLEVVNNAMVRVGMRAVPSLTTPNTVGALGLVFFNTAWEEMMTSNYREFWRTETLTLADWDSGATIDTGEKWAYVAHISYDDVLQTYLQDVSVADIVRMQQDGTSLTRAYAFARIHSNRFVVFPDQDEVNRDKYIMHGYRRLALPALDNETLPLSTSAKELLTLDVARNFASHHLGDVQTAQALELQRRRMAARQQNRDRQGPSRAGRVRV